MDIDIQDFNNLEINNRKYGGMAGLKLGIVMGNENWILKFPKSTKNFDKIEISYTTMPLSEFLGSQIYQIIGIDTHETKLGIKDKKIVVACKDFLKENERLYEFREIKNDYIEGLEEELDSISSSSGNGTDINEIMIVMNKNATFIGYPELRKRFWDMFVVDSFIGNNDRNNGNWGIIANEISNSVRVAPVYDNGGSFSNTLGDKRMELILSDELRFKESVYVSRTCAFYENDKKINPLKYIESQKNEELNEAILRIVPKIDMNRIEDLIFSVPNEYENIRIISDIQKDFYFKSLKYRYDNILMPVYNDLN